MINLSYYKLPEVTHISGAWVTFVPHLGDDDLWWLHMFCVFTATLL